MNPAESRCVEERAQTLGMSSRTLARRFLADTGMSLRSWRRRMRLLRSIELLASGLGVTRTAMELGYGSTSAFVYAFPMDMGDSPRAYMREHHPGSRSRFCRRCRPRFRRADTYSCIATDRAAPSPRWEPRGRVTSGLHDVAVVQHLVELLPAGLERVETVLQERGNQVSPHQ
ncbi:helix-turn-helix domain-containing protein [Pandoraea terrae]|nr:helix-turn-helix domain-containing protein [Pandoraea terrae]